MFKSILELRTDNFDQSLSLLLECQGDVIDQDERRFISYNRLALALVKILSDLSERDRDDALFFIMMRYENEIEKLAKPLDICNQITAQRDALSNGVE
jgi:hypothetical protein